MMFIRNGLLFLCFAIALIGLQSCWDDEDDVGYATYTDAQLLYVSISNDSVSGIAGTLFRIDQYNSQIYNPDSLAYGVELKYKTKLSYTSAANTSNVQAIINGDSTWFASGDTLDLSAPITLRVVALDGVTEKNYKFWINIHQEDPDSIQYKQLASDLSFLENENRTILFKNRFFNYSLNKGYLDVHSSSDCHSWNTELGSNLPASVRLTSFTTYKEAIYAVTDEGKLYVSEDALRWTLLLTAPDLYNIIGSVEQTSLFGENGLALLLKEGDNYSFGKYEEGTLTRGNAVPANFPVREYASINKKQVNNTVDYLFAIGGSTAASEISSSTWYTQNAITWTLISDERFDELPKVTGGNVLRYDGVLLFLNGKLADGSDNKLVYFSKNNGFAWEEAKNKYIPQGYTFRNGASLMLDNDESYFYIVGGSKNTGERLSDTWKAYMNKHIFVD